MEQEDLGKSSLPLERMRALLDPRWKILGTDSFVNGSPALRTIAKDDSKRLIAAFADEPT